MAVAKQKEPKDNRPVPTDQDVLSHLVRAHTMFESIITKDQLPLVWESELGFAVQIVQNERAQKLRWCTPDTLQAALQNIAAVGLSLNPVKQHVTLVPRWSKQYSVWEAHPMFMYRGLTYLATQAGVKGIRAEVVYKADTFKLTRGSGGDIFEHSVAIDVPRDGDNMFRGAYVDAVMPSNERKVEWVPAEDIYKMRDASESYRDEEGKLYVDAPWVRWFDEMAKKSATKRATKRWEEAVYDDTRWQRLQTAIRLDNLGETATGRTFEHEPIEVPKLSMEQITEIEKRAADIYADVAAQKHFLTKICNAYGRETLSDIAAQHYQELLDRIAATDEAVKKKRGKDRPTQK